MAATSHHGGIFPIELLDMIVFQLAPKECDHNSALSWQYWDTLVSCSPVSHALRACALKHMFRDLLVIFCEEIYCEDTRIGGIIVDDSVNSDGAD
jgi:hypothetical protein